MDVPIEPEDLMEAHGFELAVLHWAARQDDDTELVRLVEAEVQRRRELLNQPEHPMDCDL